MRLGIRGRICYTNNMVKNDIKNLIFVDCEADGKSPSTGKMTEFGAVAYPSKATFHGVLVERKPSEENPKFRIATGKTFKGRSCQIYGYFQYAKNLMDEEKERQKVARTPRNNQ